MVCGTKYSYQNKAKACGVAAKRNSILGHTPPIKAYRCPECKSWHIGHRPAKLH